MDKFTLIGEGGNWRIYRTPLSNSPSIIRIPKMKVGNIQSYITNHEMVRSVGMNTLIKVEQVITEKYSGIQSEDLNFQKDRIYVTPNSLYTDSHIEKHQLVRELLNSPNITPSSPEAELFRYKNKIHKILNFNSFTTDIIKQLKHAANKKILIEFDSYFFGTERNQTETKIDYIIADLDNIYHLGKHSVNSIHKLNLSHFFNSLNLFIKYFVVTSSQLEYHEYIRLMQPSKS